jgi:hypothetical protein
MLPVSIIIYADTFLLRVDGDECLTGNNKTAQHKGTVQLEHTAEYLSRQCHVFSNVPTQTLQIKHGSQLAVAMVIMTNML